MEHTVKNFLVSLPSVLESKPAAAAVITDLILHTIRTILCDKVLELGLRRVLVEAISPLAKVGAGLCEPGELKVLLKPATEMLFEKYWAVGLRGNSTESITTLPELLQVMNLLNSSALLTPPSTPDYEEEENFILSVEDHPTSSVDHPIPPARITYSRQEVLALKHMKMLVKLPVMAHLLGIVKGTTSAEEKITSKRPHRASNVLERRWETATKGNQVSSNNQSGLTRADLVERWEHDLFDPTY